MDGFESNEGVIIIAATNRPDVLDPAILRPGRFDRRITVPRPDVRGREEILRVHAKRTPLSPDVDLEVIARGTPGFSGADLENLVNEAALLAARQDKDARRTWSTSSSRRTRSTWGPSAARWSSATRRSSTTAVHEAGHTLISVLIKHHDPVHKVTIIPRGPALGVTWYLPKDDRHNLSKEQAESSIAVALGGRIAEEIVFGADDDRRGQRHREGDRDRPQDGLRVGHEREARAARLRQEGGVDLPRPRLRRSARRTTRSRPRKKSIRKFARSCNGSTFG